MKKIVIIFLLGAIVCGCTNPTATKMISVASAPAADRYTSINKEGETVIPNGRLITPIGKQIFVAPHPFGLTLSPDGKTIITANSGVGPFSISIINDFNSSSPFVKQIPETQDPEKGLLEAVFMGLAVSPDGKKVYVAGGQQNVIYIFDLITSKKLGEISCKTADYQDGYIGDMVMNKDGSHLYAIDQIGFRMMIIDTKTNKVMTRPENS